MYKNQLFKHLIVLASINLTCFAEDSVFLANSYESLTSSEKKVLKNTKELQKLKSTMGTLKYKTSNLNDKIESLVASVSLFTNSISDVKTSIHSNKPDNTIPTKIDTLENKIIVLEKSNTKMNQLIFTMTDIIDSINSNYIAKEQFEVAFKTLENRLFKLENNDIVYSFSSNNYTLMNNALKAYNSKKYSLSKAKFEELIIRNFKPAKSNYYLGEINYFQRIYSKAINYFKTSFKLYSKSDYIPNLLLHSGISLVKLKEKQKSKKFFNILIDLYPKSKEAKQAKKYI